MATTCDEADVNLLYRKAKRLAQRLCEKHPQLDRDAAESVAMEAVCETLRKWEQKRASLASYGEALIQRRLESARGRGVLFGDRLRRRFDAEPLDATGDGDDASYCDQRPSETDVDDRIAGLGLSEADERLLRERLGGDHSTVGRSDLTRGSVGAALRRIRAAFEAAIAREEGR